MDVGPGGGRGDLTGRKKSGREERFREKWPKTTAGKREAMSRYKGEMGKNLGIREKISLKTGILDIQ